MKKIIELPSGFGENTTSTNEFVVYYFIRNKNGKYKFMLDNIILYSFDIQHMYCDTFIIQKGKIVPALEVIPVYDDKKAGCSLFEVIDKDKFKKIRIPFNNVFYSRIEAEEFAKYLCEKYPINE